jgi:hypothetical protein
MMDLLGQYAYCQIVYGMEKCCSGLQPFQDQKTSLELDPAYKLFIALHPPVT